MGCKTSLGGSGASWPQIIESWISSLNWCWLSSCVFALCWVLGRQPWATEDFHIWSLHLSKARQITHTWTKKSRMPSNADVPGRRWNRWCKSVVWWGWQNGRRSCLGERTRKIEPKQVQSPGGRNKEPSRNLDPELLSKVGFSVETGTFYRATERGRIEKCFCRVNFSKSWEMMWARDSVEIITRLVWWNVCSKLNIKDQRRAAGFCPYFA